MNEIIRAGRIQDAEDFAKLIYISDSELLPSIFSDKVQDLMVFLFKEKENYFSYKNTYFVEIDNKIAGMFLAYHYKVFKKVDLHTGILLLKYFKLDLLKQIIYLIKGLNVINERKENCYYISNIAIYPQFRNRGIGSLLLVKIEEIAKKRYKGIELDVSVKNRSAIRLYKRKGYKIIKRKLNIKIGKKTFGFFRMRKTLN